MYSKTSYSFDVRLLEFGDKSGTSIILRNDCFALGNKICKARFMRKAGISAYPGCKGGEWQLRPALLPFEGAFVGQVQRRSG